MNSDDKESSAQDSQINLSEDEVVIFDDKCEFDPSALRPMQED